MKILVTGASGMLGTNLNEVLSENHSLYGIARGEEPESNFEKWSGWFSEDLTSYSNIKNYALELKPDAIVHCAAMTNVDQCEKMVKEAEALHISATENLANIAEVLDVPLVYISTDQVYTGKGSTPFPENGEIGPVNVYAKTKLAGEEKALKWNKSLVIRTNIFGIRSKGPDSFGEWVFNGLKDQAELTMFNDVFFSPISTYDLSEIIEKCLDNSVTGVINLGCSESISKYEFANILADLTGYSKDNLISIKLSEKGLSADRPVFMSMSCKRVEELLKLAVPSVRSSMGKWLNYLKKHGEL